ncbi:cupin domain-containing protein [Marinibacterium profundimaris]|uniref:Cupin n=1 Tax=Marinibacterium profundimaris TaxID=1679460 RepID=A0A225NSH6_9RHOB|nr:cupin domain-containing protein [Marinibacterium profundimaris]OWU77793.1 cupin [Marinibacterium profundimaris]
MTADDIIAHLGLTAHPEGGHYRETWRTGGDGRPHATGIYFLLKAGERSHWHRVDADEVWLYHSGAPLTLSIAATEAGPAQDHTLSPDLATGAPQVVVPKDHWQAAETTGDWTLVSCVVAPGFSFDGFLLAEPDFDIPRA